MNTKIPFQKQFTPANQLVTLLQQRGLIITNPDKAEHYLRNIGYYRLSAYMHPLLSFPKEKHTFKPKSNFTQVLSLYRFDKKLRLLIFNEIEKIEIAIRSCIVNTTCNQLQDSFWITNKLYFVNQQKFNKTILLIDNELEHTKEDFIIHFRNKYSNPYPPAWILSEILPFGVLTNIFSNLKEKRIKKQIALQFGLQLKPFESWLTIITLTRNACCHHARIWNKQNSIMPMEPKSTSKVWIQTKVSKLRIYYNLCIIKWFIDHISPNNDLTHKIQNLLQTFPTIDIKAMGFSPNWQEEPLWKREEEEV
jgi:abortive infection bacteriophage resistance protein